MPVSYRVQSNIQSTVCTFTLHHLATNSSRMCTPYSSVYVQYGVTTPYLVSRDGRKDPSVQPQCTLYLLGLWCLDQKTQYGVHVRSTEYQWQWRKYSVRSTPRNGSSWRRSTYHMPIHTANKVRSRRETLICTSVAFPSPKLCIIHQEQSSV